MSAPPIRAAADTPGDIDRLASGVDSATTRQGRTDLPGERSAQPGGGTKTPGDVYIDAARELSQQSLDPAQEAFDADRELERIADGDPDVELPAEDRASVESGRDANANDAIDETKRVEGDSTR
jgi:hypothetical protein